MRIADCHWQQVEGLLGSCQTCVLPLGCTEQHAYLSLATDSILAERVSVEAAGPLGIPVFPVLPYGMTPHFAAYSGTVTIQVETYCRFLRAILESLGTQGFDRILVVNGHGGNSPAKVVAREITAAGGPSIKWHDWWNAPLTWGKVVSIDPQAGHASWMENFPWTRLEGVDQPKGAKPVVDYGSATLLDAEGARELIGDGNFGGRYQRSDVDMREVWSVAVEETRSMLTDW